MPSTASVLLYGNDTHLLRTRRWLVESSGLQVFATDQMLALNQIFTEHPIDVLVLCHSLSFEERERAKAIAQAHSPRTKVLVLAVTEAGVRARSSDRMISTADGPKVLLDVVEQLAASRIPPEPRREKEPKERMA